MAAFHLVFNHSGPGLFRGASNADLGSVTSIFAITMTASNLKQL